MEGLVIIIGVVSNGLITLYSAENSVGVLVVL